MSASLFKPKSEPIKLRPYQMAAVEAIYQSLRMRDDNPCCVLPTAAGKTPVIATICGDAVERWNGRVLILAHVKELLVQATEKLSAICPNVDIGLYSAGLKRRETQKPVIVAGIQSVYKRADELGRFDLIIVDECNLIPADGEGMYRTFLEDSKIINPKVRLIGMTATPYRMRSGMICSEENLLNHICYEVGVKELIVQGYISKLITKAGKRKADLEDVEIRGGEFVLDQLEKAMDTNTLVDSAVNEIKEETKKRKSCLIFCSGVKHAEHVHEVIEKVTGEKAGLITGQTNSLFRQNQLEDFKRGKLKYLVNVNVLTIGFDAPNIDCIVMLRPTHSPGLYYQMCLDTKTEILTQRGWMTHETIDNLDLVAAVNIKTKIPKMSWELTQDIIYRKMVDGENLVTIKSNSVDICVTDKHDMIVTGRRSQEGWKKEIAEKTVERKTEYRIPVASIEEDRNIGIPISDYDIQFIGWFLTDGNLNFRTNAIAISQSSAGAHFHEIEKMLHGCKFKYGKHLIKSKTQFKENAPRYIFTISRGMPRGRDKHLTGWNRLEEYIYDKDMTFKLQELNVRQFEILLKTIHWGDGRKYSGKKWTQRSYHITTARERFANRLQSLCLRRGYRCNISTCKTLKNKNLYNLHIKKQSYRTIGGQNQSDRQSLKTIVSAKNESVWCVKVPSGAFIARRNGKAFITGNCGRGFRIWPGKENCLVLDFADNIMRHGPIDEIDGSIDPKTGGAAGVAPAKTCPECRAVIAVGYTICPQCGEKLPRDDKAKHNANASNNPILSQGEPVVSERGVTRYMAFEHTKRGTENDPEHPKTCRVDYNIGWQEKVSEWLCFEHEGFAYQKAVSWWMKRSNAPIPVTAAQAADLINNFDAVAKTISITTSKLPGEQFDSIIGYKLGDVPKWNDEDEKTFEKLTIAPKVKNQENTIDWDEEVIPF